MLFFGRDVQVDGFGAYRWVVFGWFVGRANSNAELIFKESKKAGLL